MAHQAICPHNNSGKNPEIWSKSYKFAFNFYPFPAPNIEQYTNSGYTTDIELSKKGYRRDIEIYFYFSATILMISSETTCQKAFAQNKATEVPVPFLP